MRFDRVSIRNFKPYENVDLRLRDGVTVIHGLNGSGKSSLLEACFFALYGAKALDETLGDVITTGEDEAEIALEFTHDGAEYRVDRRLRASGERTQTARCVLEGPEGTVEGARDVRRRVTELLRMDAEAFVNCAYVRQGEVNKLINARPSARQDMIDDLLQLGKLEEYRERAREARLGVNDVLADRRGRLNELESQIEDKEEEDLHERKNAVETELREVAGEIERFEENRERARETREDAQAVLDSHEEKREQLAELAEEVADLEETITATERERDELGDEIGDHRERVEELRSEIETQVADTDLDATRSETIESRLDDLDGRIDELSERRNEAELRAQALETQADNLREKADDLAERARTRRGRADELEQEAASAEADLAEDRERLDAIDDEVAAAKARFEGAPIEFGEAEEYRDRLRERREELRERQQEVSTELNALRRRVEEAESLLEEGKCPECGQPVADSPHVDGLEDDRERVEQLRSTLSDLGDEREGVEDDVEAAEALLEAESEVSRLETERENVDQLLGEREATIEEKREQADELREEATELEGDATEKREAAESQSTRAEEKRAEIAEVEDELESARETRERLEAIRERRETVAETESEIERLRERRENLREWNDERRETLAEKRERRDELEASVDEEKLEAAREEKARAGEYLERVEEKLDELVERRDDLRGTLGGIENELAELERLREQRAALGERVDALESLHDETEQLERMYGDLRADLRQRNVRSLERMLNETFDLVYGNDAYSHIRLDGEYELTVFQKDGTALSPEQLSGGERALFNLSLRTAIYRLLGEGIEGAAPMPPLILDEPTVFLDSGHVSRLVDLVEEMRDLGVRQIVIVSHDDELVGAADELVRVEKNPTSNRSHVERGALVEST